MENSPIAVLRNALLPNVGNLSLSRSLSRSLSASQVSKTSRWTFNSKVTFPTFRLSYAETEVKCVVYPSVLARAAARSLPSSLSVVFQDSCAGSYPGVSTFLGLPCLPWFVASGCSLPSAATKIKKEKKRKEKKKWLSGNFARFQEEQSRERNV